ncbi:hypothetical protein TREAZ_2878 [Leadbettera azotonutricia ZAS-9]|uniref:Uncharacterized protein n=1 Tax=Leadbettera azotonutricia (strain ATCC BAA-888 / DSM 13862 / ZAS-9) TaxID=545695 RepID=F5YCD4_LEAAZ|nr:hypothetical protein TREAZ_2878 [Leadbettera azotonutricia ZAS-9]
MGKYVKRNSQDFIKKRRRRTFPLAGLSLWVKHFNSVV